MWLADKRRARLRTAIKNAPESHRCAMTQLIWRVSHDTVSAHLATACALQSGLDSCGFCSCASVDKQFQLPAVMTSMFAGGPFARQAIQLHIWHAVVDMVTAVYQKPSGRAVSDGCRTSCGVLESSAILRCACSVAICALCTQSKQYQCCMRPSHAPAHIAMHRAPIVKLTCM